MLAVFRCGRKRALLGAKISKALERVHERRLEERKEEKYLVPIAELVIPSPDNRENKPKNS